jgi:Protein of unknown function (DUF3341)
VETKVKAVYGYLAEFDNPQDLYHAAEQVRDQGYQRWDVHSPFPIHGMNDAMGMSRSKLPWFVFFGGLTGLSVAFVLQTLTQTTFWGDIGLGFLQKLAETYPTVVQGKPIHIWTLPAFFPVMFELTILFSAFTTLFGLLGMMQLPRLNHPLFASKQFKKFSDDGFFISIEARDQKFQVERTKGFLEGIGGKNIELVQDDIA